MKKYQSIILMLFVVIILNSCTIPQRLSYTSASSFVKNYSKEKVIDYIDQTPEEFTVNVKESNKPVSVLLYKRWVQYEKSMLIIESGQYDLFAFSFVDNQLIFWGNIDDFKRSEDEKIANIGREISKFVLENH